MFDISARYCGAFDIFLKKTQSQESFGNESSDYANRNRQPEWGDAGDHLRVWNYLFSSNFLTAISLSWTNDGWNASTGDNQDRSNVSMADYNQTNPRNLGRIHQNWIMRLYLNTVNTKQVRHKNSNSGAFGGRGGGAQATWSWILIVLNTNI